MTWLQITLLQNWTRSLIMLAASILLLEWRAKPHEYEMSYAFPKILFSSLLFWKLSFHLIDKCCLFVPSFSGKNEEKLLNSFIFQNFHFQILYFGRIFACVLFVEEFVLMITNYFSRERFGKTRRERERCLRTSWNKCGGIYLCMKSVWVCCEYHISYHSVLAPPHSHRPSFFLLCLVFHSKFGS